MLIKNLKVYSNTDRSFYEADILIDGGKIVKIGNEDVECDEMIDAKGAYAFPGLVDVHTHGIGGHDWCSYDVDGFHDMARKYAEKGITTVMPTLSSAPLERMLAATDLLNNFSSNEGEADICGVHWEGRFLNPEKKGAHAPELITPLVSDDIDDPILTSCKRLHISAAYELDRDGSFAKKAKEIGATMGLAHTMASYNEAKTCEERGIVSYTHLYNAMPPLHHRDGGCIAAAFEGNAYAEIICDGIHISPEMVRLAYRNLGIERMSLVSDSLDATGLPDGNYFSSGLAVTVKDGICRIASGALAGSTITLDKAVRNLSRFCNIPITEAILAATENPARQIGAFDECGSLEAGKRANILIVRDLESFCIEIVIVGGRTLLNKK